MRPELRTLPVVALLTFAAVGETTISSVCLPGGSSAVGSYTLASVIAQPTRLATQGAGAAQLDPGYLCIDASDLGRVGDINGDGVVNGIDLATILADWGTTADRSDLDRNGSVNGADLALVLANWG